MAAQTAGPVAWRREALLGLSDGLDSYCTWVDFTLRASGSHVLRNADMYVVHTDGQSRRRMDGLRAVGH
jgi:hypothetical protein